MELQLFANKPKVHPVNPALLNSVRQRDPRLARQMHAASSHPAAPARNDPRLEAKSSSSQKSSRSRSKSPVRNSSSRSGKSGSSSHSSSSSRKRSESKSSTTSSSSSSSDVRHKGVTASSSNQPTVKRSGKITSKDSDRYVRNGSPLGSAKRKSSSPSSSPSKSKRSTSHKSSSSRGKASSLRSRSRSPVFMDVDLRTGVRSKSPESRAVAPSSLPLAGASLPASAKAPKDLEKRKKQLLILISHLLANNQVWFDLEPRATDSLVENLEYINQNGGTRWLRLVEGRVIGTVCGWQVEIFCSTLTEVCDKYNCDTKVAFPTMECVKL